MSGGITPYTYSAIGLPTGITINSSTGIISGAPTDVSIAKTATITVTDANEASKSITINVGAVSEEE